MQMGRRILESCRDIAARKRNMRSMFRETINAANSAAIRPVDGVKT